MPIGHTIDIPLSTSDYSALNATISTKAGGIWVLRFELETRPLIEVLFLAVQSGVGVGRPSLATLDRKHRTRRQHRNA